MIETRPAERRDILKVFKEMSPQTAADMRHLQLGPDEILGFYGLRVPEPDAVTFVEDGEPIGLCGWDKEPGAWYSWALASTRYYRPDPAPVFASRRYLKRVRKANPKTLLLTIAAQDTEDLRRWLGCLGFVRLQQSPLNVWMFAG